LAADLPSGIPLPMAVGFVGADWIEVLTAAMLLRKFSKSPPQFNNLKKTTIYIICCVLIAPFVAAFPGALVTGMGQAGSAFLTRWSRWFISDALTHLLITPFIVLWISWNLSEFRSRSFSYYLELFCLSAISLPPVQIRSVYHYELTIL
jgi:integral membrane sensor domain MASE1